MRAGIALPDRGKVQPAKLAADDPQDLRIAFRSASGRPRSRVDRLAHFQNALADHVVAGRVDRVNGQECLPSLKYQWLCPLSPNARVTTWV